MVGHMDFALPWLTSVQASPLIVNYVIFEKVICLIYSQFSQL